LCRHRTHNEKCGPQVGETPACGKLPPPPPRATETNTVLHAAQAIKNNKSEKEVYSKSLAGVNSFDIVFLRFPGPVCDPSRVVLCFCVFGALLLLVKLHEGVITQVGNA
jgi:hypothetical protein